MEGIDEIVEGGLEDCEEAEAHKDGADVGRDPVDIWAAGPAEDEEACGEDDRPEHHGWETGFGNGEVVVLFEAGDVELLVVEVDACAHEDADEVGEEGKRADDLVPAADFLEFNGEGSQTEVEDAVDEGGVEGDEEADGGCEEGERTD